MTLIRICAAQGGGGGRWRERKARGGSPAGACSCSSRGRYCVTGSSPPLQRDSPSDELNMIHRFTC